MHGCSSEEVFKNHLERCKLHRAQRIKLQAGDKKGREKVKFTKTEYQLHLPFVIYADFKSVLCKQDSCEPSSSKSFFNQYQHNVLCGSGITSNFKWFTGKEIKELDVVMVPDDGSRGYILECDLGKYYFYYIYIYVYFMKCSVFLLCISADYPRDFIKCNVSFLCISDYPHEFHDLDKYYPLTPKRLQIKESILSSYQHYLLQDEGFSKPPPTLALNFCNKTSYIIHYHSLKLYLELGLRLTNVHRVLSSYQLLWLKNYIKFNTCQ